MAERGQLPGLRRVGRRLLVNRLDLLRWREASVPSLPEERTGSGGESRLGRIAEESTRESSRGVEADEGRKAWDVDLTVVRTER